MIPRIVKRGDLYALCYRYTDHADKKHIKLEPCASLDDARIRLEEVMQQQEKGIEDSVEALARDILRPSNYSARQELVYTVAENATPVPNGWKAWALSGR